MANPNEVPQDLHKKCVRCSQTFPSSDLEHVPCGHYFCRECLISRFKYSLAKDKYFPTSCCKQRIPLSLQVIIWLPARIIGRYHDKKEKAEADESEHKRTYCHAPQCSTLLKPENITGNKASCPKCEALTCIVCKEEYHDNGVCTKKGGSQAPEVEGLAVREGWPGCYSCASKIPRFASFPSLHTRKAFHHQIR